jgi:hypothetical protein
MEPMIDMSLPNKPEELKPWIFEAIKVEEPSQDRLFEIAAKVFMWQEYAQAIEGHLKKFTLMLMKLSVEYNQAVGMLEKIHELMHSEEAVADPFTQFLHEFTQEEGNWKNETPDFFGDSSGHDEAE